MPFEVFVSIPPSKTIECTTMVIILVEKTTSVKEIKLLIHEKLKEQKRGLVEPSEMRLVMLSDYDQSSEKKYEFEEDDKQLQDYENISSSRPISLLLLQK